MTREINGDWDKLRHDRNAIGVYLVDIDISGKTFRFSDSDFDFIDSTGYRLHYESALLGSVRINERLDFISKSVSTSSVTLSVIHSRFPLLDYMKQGINVQDSTVKIYYAIVNQSSYARPSKELLSVHARMLLLEGELLEPVINIYSNTVSFVVNDYRVMNDLQFPPIIASTDRIADMDPESVGKVYPIVYGTVKKLPIFHVDHSNWPDVYEYCAFDSKEQTAVTGNPTALYDGDEQIASVAQLSGANASDLLGGSYYKITSTIGTVYETRRVTVDVTGYQEITLGDVFSSLLRNYSKYTDLISFESISRLNHTLGQINFGFIVNTDIQGGVFSFIKSRLLNQVPATMYHDGSQYKFLSLIWDKTCVRKTLSTTSNIIQCVGGIRETNKTSVFNEFVFNSYRSNYRNDWTETSIVNGNNNYECLVSEKTYGKRSYGVIDLGDIVGGISTISNWYIETFSKVRLIVSYECTLDVFDLELWDTVELIDHDNNLQNGVLCKVVGIERSKTIRVDLISIEDRMMVWRGNVDMVDGLDDLDYYRFG